MLFHLLPPLPLLPSLFHQLLPVHTLRVTMPLFHHLASPLPLVSPRSTCMLPPPTPQAQQAEDSAAELAAMRSLAALLTRTRQPPLSSITYLLRDSLSDAAIRLWQFVSPIIRANQEHSARQLLNTEPQATFSHSSPSQAQHAVPVSRAARLRLTITPASEGELNKLLHALCAIAASSADELSYTQHDRQVTLYGDLHMKPSLPHRFPLSQQARRPSSLPS